MDEMFLIVVILSASLIVLVRHWVLLMVQIGFAILVYQVLPIEIIGFMLLVQILFSLWIVARVCYAAHYHYQLENEKTHRIPQHFTIKGDAGMKKSFLMFKKGH